MSYKESVSFPPAAGDLMSGMSHDGTVPRKGAHNLQAGSFLVGQQALDYAAQTRPPVLFTGTQTHTLTQQKNNQYNTYQADNELKFNSLNGAINPDCHRTEEPGLGADEGSSQRKIADPTTVEEMHCHIVMQIQKLRKIAMDLEYKIAQQE